MKKKTMFFVLTLFSVLASVLISSCSKEEPVKTQKYYLQLAFVETNCKNINSESLKAEWIAENEADSQGVIFLGEMTQKEAIEYFDNEIESLSYMFTDIYANKEIIPKGGYLIYSFSLIPEPWLPTYSHIRYGVIEINNFGASYFFG